MSEFNTVNTWLLDNLRGFLGKMVALGALTIAVITGITNLDG